MYKLTNLSSKIKVLIILYERCDLQSTLLIIPNGRYHDKNYFTKLSIHSI